MKITVLSMWHNEAFLAPFFLGHYAYADKIHLIIGDDTTDETLDVCTKYPNVEIEKFNFPDGLLNDMLKIEKFNTVLPTLDADWVFALDADELIFAPDNGDIRDFLARQRQGVSVIYVKMWQAYKNNTEDVLNPSIPALWQRRHGNPEFHHIKPVVVRPGCGIKWYAGHHGFEWNARIVPSAESLLGTHWGMADADNTIRRYIHGRRNRMSKANIERRHGYHTFDLTEEKIRAECEKHLNDPKLF